VEKEHNTDSDLSLPFSLGPAACECVCAARVMDVLYYFIKKDLEVRLRIINYK